MANPERGEVDLEVNGKRYRLALGMGGLRQIQKMVSTPEHRVTLVQAMDGAIRGDIEYLCAVVWGALQRHHPELTQADVDAIIDELGGISGLPVVLKKINDLMAATQPDERDRGLIKKAAAANAQTPTETPPVTVGTIGPGSISKRAKSA